MRSNGSQRWVDLNSGSSANATKSWRGERCKRAPVTDSRQNAREQLCQLQLVQRILFKCRTFSLVHFAWSSNRNGISKAFKDSFVFRVAGFLQSGPLRSPSGWLVSAALNIKTRLLSRQDEETNISFVLAVRKCICNASLARELCHSLNYFQLSLESLKSSVAHVNRFSKSSKSLLLVPDSQHLGFIK